MARDFVTTPVEGVPSVLRLSGRLIDARSLERDAALQSVGRCRSAISHEYILFWAPEKPETTANRHFHCPRSDGLPTIQVSEGLRRRRLSRAFRFEADHPGRPSRRRAGEAARRGERLVAYFCMLVCRSPALAHAASLSSRSQRANRSVGCTAFRGSAGGELLFDECRPVARTGAAAWHG